MNYWIVSRHNFVLHGSPEKALAEAARLQAKDGVPFHVYRVKEKLLLGDKPGAITPSLSDNKEQIA